MKKTFLFLASAVLLWGANLEHKELESMCENEDAKSCFELGNKFEESKNYQKAGEFYKKACEMGFGDGCHNLGVIYYEAEGAEANKNLAKKYFGKSCELGNDEDCQIYNGL